MAVLAPPGTLPPATGPTPSAAPNQSLYIQNLPDKIQKDDLKRELYMLFSAYGPVIDVTAVKNAKMRGQAHVLFKDIPTANLALRQCQGFDFFGKEMKISYSKNRSNTVAKLTGTFNPPVDPAKTPAPAPFAAAAMPPRPAGLPPPPGLPAKVNGDAPALLPPSKEPDDVASPQGTKRQREDDSEDEDAPMDEEEDEEGGEMEMSDSD